MIFPPKPDGDPRDWVSRGGKPARCFPSGLPSFEHDDGTVVMDVLVVQADHEGQVRLFPSWYGMAAMLAPDGLVPVSHSPDARWEYRPIIYRFCAWGYFERQGSQVELEWRKQIEVWTHAEHGDDETKREMMAECLRKIAACGKARALLFEHLTPQQRIEYLSLNRFYMRGFSGSTYCVRYGDGFALVSPFTHVQWASFCLHPEHYIPHDDVMLATKLMLEDEELEQEAIGNANSTSLPIGRGSTEEDRVAMKLERELLAA